MADIEANAKTREASGSVEFPAEDWLTSFLYVLMRDASPVGEVEAVVRSLEQEVRKDKTRYTNGWLALYARHLADRLRAVGSLPPP